MKCRITTTTLACPACSTLPLDARCPAVCARNFVLGGWSTSFKHSRDSGLITAEDYKAVSHQQIAKICARRETKVMVAADLVYLGFIAGEPDERIVYYVFVKDEYRRHGIARRLFEAFGIEPGSRFAYPASTRMLDDPHIALKRKIPRAVRDPAVARYPKHERHRSYAV